MPIPYPEFKPALRLPIGGVTGVEGVSGVPGATGQETEKQATDPLAALLPFLLGQGSTQGTAEIASRGAQGGQVGAPAPMNPTLGALLQHFGSGATRRNMSGQLEGQPAPDPFTNLNAMRESQQAHDLDRMNQSIAMRDLRAQGGQLPLAPFTPGAPQIREDLAARQGLGSRQHMQGSGPEYGPYGPAPEGPNWGNTPQWNERWLTDPEGTRFDTPGYQLQGAGSYSQAAVGPDPAGLGDPFGVRGDPFAPSGPDTEFYGMESGGAAPSPYGGDPFTFNPQRINQPLSPMTIPDPTTHMGTYRPMNPVWGSGQSAWSPAPPQAQPLFQFPVTEYKTPTRGR